MERNINKKISIREDRLIDMCREIDFGEIELTVHDGQPHTFRKITRNIRLDIITIDKNALGD